MIKVIKHGYNRYQTQCNNCKCEFEYELEDIENGLALLQEFKEMFIKRMSVDNGTDRREKDYNRAIFFLYETAGEYKQCFNDTTMEMVLDKFDLAVKDWRKSFCDIDNCTRK